MWNYALMPKALNRYGYFKSFVSKLIQSQTLSSYISFTVMVIHTLLSCQINGHISTNFLQCALTGLSVSSNK